jgi:hypothetical protein
MDLYVHSPIRLHGVVLNYLSTETTLQFCILGGLMKVYDAPSEMFQTNGNLWIFAYQENIN